LYLKDQNGQWSELKTVNGSNNNYTFTKIPSGEYLIEAYTYGNPRGAVITYVAPKSIVSVQIVATN